MPLPLLGLIFGGALLIISIIALTRYVERGRRFAQTACDAGSANDTSFVPAVFSSDGGDSGCSSADGGAGCDGGGGGD